MWHHAIHDHENMVKEMSVEQFTQIMKSWDKDFKNLENVEFVTKG